MNVELEMKDFVKDFNGQSNKNEIFYRYNIDGVLVWFDQYIDSGHIYAVTVRTPDWIRENFQFYVYDGSQHDYYYPEFVEINTKHERLSVDQVDGYMNGLAYAQKLAQAIMEIFDTGKHMELYKLHHAEM